MPRVHKLVIENLDDHEAELLGQIIESYRADMMVKRIGAFCNAKRNNTDTIIATEWYTGHLEWFNGIIDKMSWTYDELTEEPSCGEI